MGRDRVISDSTQIVEAAYDLIDRSGFKEFSSRKLAQALGISHMTVYNYMSRDELLKGVIFMGFSRLEALYMPRVESCMQSDKHCVGLLCIAQELLSFARTHPNMYKFMFHERLKLKVDNPRVLGLYKSGTDRILVDLPSEQREAIRADAYLFFVLANGLILGHLGQRHSVSHDQCNKNIMRGFDLLMADHLD